VLRDPTQTPPELRAAPTVAAMNKTTVLLDAGSVLIDETTLEEFICVLIVELVQTEDASYTAQDYWSDTKEAILRFCPSIPRYVLWKRCGGRAEKYQDLLTRYTQAMRESRPPLELHEEMEDEIPALAGVFRLVLAGQYGNEVYDLLARYDLARLFANRLSQQDFGITKPDPRYLAQIADRSGVRTDECIMVGDRIDKDVIPGKQNGMGTVFVRTGIYRIQEPRTLEEAPDITMEGLSGLAEEVIKRWRC